MCIEGLLRASGNQGLGENNPYKMLWPENLHSKFDFAIPQSIISELRLMLLEAQYQSTQRQFNRHFGNE